MQNPLIRPRGGLLRLGGGLIKPRGGLLSGLNARAGGAVIPHTLDGIANAADPLQAFADACGMSFKMDYIWIGNPATGNIIELGGSGIDLVNTGVTQGQADARLGDGNTCLFNAAGDKLTVSDAALNSGVSSLAWFSVHAFNSTAALGYLGGKYDGATGWFSYTDTSGRRIFGTRAAGGTQAAMATANHGTVEAQVDLMRRNVTTTTNHIDTRFGSGSTTSSLVGDDGDNAAAFSVGQSTSGSFLGSWGLTALKFGPDAELVTATHRSNLQTWLGF